MLKDNGFITDEDHASFVVSGNTENYIGIVDASEVEESLYRGLSADTNNSGQTEPERRVVLDVKKYISNVWEKISQDRVASVHFNITRGICDEITASIRPMHTFAEDRTISQFCGHVAENIADEAKKEEFFRRFSGDGLQGKLSKGIMHADMIVPFTLDTNDILWLKIIMDIFHNPDTGDLEAVGSMQDVDEQMRLQRTVDYLIESEYDVIAQIDAITGSLKYLGENEFKHRIHGSDYQTAYKEAVKQFAMPEYVSAAMESLRLDNVVNKLKDNDRFVYLFPGSIGGMEANYQWRFAYLGKHRRMILLTVVNVSRNVDGSMDMLTGLLNRNAFCDKIRHAIDENPDKKYRIIRVDFDGFKFLNDELGFMGGNRFLRLFGSELLNRSQSFGKDSIVSRFDADHFLVFVPADGISPEEMYAELSGQNEKNNS